jgi:hypothetical protein
MDQPDVWGMRVQRKLCHWHSQVAVSHDVADLADLVVDRQILAVYVTLAWESTRLEQSHQVDGGDFPWKVRESDTSATFNGMHQLHPGFRTDLGLQQEEPEGSLWVQTFEILYTQLPYDLVDLNRDASFHQPGSRSPSCDDGPLRDAWRS